MTIVFLFRIGYLATLDASGVVLAFGENHDRSPGAERFRHCWTWVFPWWFSLSSWQQRLYVWRLTRKQKAWDKKKARLAFQQAKD